MQTDYQIKKSAIVQAAFLVAIPPGAKVTVKHKADGTYPTIEHMIKSLLEEALKDAGITAKPEIIVEVLAKGDEDPRWKRSRNGKVLQDTYNHQIANRAIMPPTPALGSGENGL